MRKRHLLVVLGICGLLFGATASGCGGGSLTDNPLSVDIYVDATFSNQNFARGCLPDVMSAAGLAAASRGSVSLHTFDGDPFHRRGISQTFGEEDLPPDLKETSVEAEAQYLEEAAAGLEGQFEKLIAEPASVGGSPLVDLLERAAGEGAPDDAVRRLLICTDGLFTDLRFGDAGAREAEAQGRRRLRALAGVGIDFIGIDGSASGRGRFLAQMKPSVEALLRGAGAGFGAWSLELGPHWRAAVVEELGEPGK